MNIKLLKIDEGQEISYFTNRLAEMMGDVENLTFLLPIIVNELGRFVYDNKSWTDTQRVVIQRFIEMNNIVVSYSIGIFCFIA